MAHQFIVQELKTRLDRFLAQQLPDVSRSQIQRDIESSLVSVNGAAARESKFVVRLGDRVSYKLPERREAKLEPSTMPLKVLYNDRGLLIIDKPAGLSVHPGAGFKGETLASALLYSFRDIAVVGEEHRPGIVHRLDKDTSGVILVAKTPEMYEFLKNAFAERKIRKEYIALVAGRVEKPHGFIETPIGRSKTDFRKYTAEDPVEAKPSLTEYRVLEYLSEPPSPPLQKPKAGVDTLTLVMVKLHTGRTHQIRVHFSSIGHPLIGDQLYGGKRVVRHDLHRQFLHAKRIEVQLPDQTWIEAESEFPKDLKEVLSHLNSKTVKTL